MLGEPNKRRTTKSDIRYGNNGSLSINPKDGTWYSHEDSVGGGILDLIERLTGARDGERWERLAELTGYQRERRKTSATLGPIDAEYVYQDPEGIPRLRVTRHQPKDFRQWRPGGKGGWVPGAPMLAQHRLLPYRLPEVLEAIASERPVFVVEGEKDCDNGAKGLGITATCNAGGASKSPDKCKWRPEHAAHFGGADVIVVPDNDEAGRCHADGVARSLQGVAKRVRILTLPDLTPGGDLTDWIKTGGTAEKLWALVEQAPDWAPPADGQQPPAAQSDADAVTWPVLDQKAMYGVAGEMARLATANTEADPVAVLATVLTWAGALFGRNSYKPLGDGSAHPRLFAACVGASARARKGTSYDPVRRVMERVNEVLGDELALNDVSGLSTGEGLIHHIRDPKETDDNEKKTSEKKKSDKRLLVYEPELGRVLRAASRQGSTLTAVMRQAWDGVRLSIMTRADPVTASKPHVCIVGHITRTELGNLLQTDDIWNGFANRFLWFCVRRRAIIPFPVGISDADVKSLAGTITAAARRALGSYGEIDWSVDARELWGMVYPEITADLPGVLGVVTARAEAQIPRLALIYALLDRANAIELVHLEAALALHRYAMESARFIFAADGEVPRDPVAERILAALAAGEKTQSQLRDLFGRNLSGGQLGRTLQGLQERGQVVSRRAATKGGRPPLFWSLSPTTKTT